MARLAPVVVGDVRLVFWFADGGVYGLVGEGRGREFCLLARTFGSHFEGVDLGWVQPRDCKFHISERSQMGTLVVVPEYLPPSTPIPKDAKKTKKKATATDPRT